MVEKKQYYFLTALAVVILTSCVNQINSHQKDSGGLPNIKDGASVGTEIILPSSYRDAHEWRHINNIMNWYLGYTGNEIMQDLEIRYHLYLNGDEYLGSSELTYYFEFENTAGSILERKCDAVYVDHRRLLFELRKLNNESDELFSENVMGFLGADVNWGVESGHEYFQYSFEDIIVRFYVDENSGALLENSYALIAKPSARRGKLVTGVDIPIIPYVTLERPEWNVINKYKREIGKTMEEIGYPNDFQYDDEWNNYRNIKTGINYSFGGYDERCRIVVFPVREFLPFLTDEISIEELQNHLNVDLIWFNYSDSFLLVFEDLRLWLPADMELNVLLKGLAILKSM